ncbi:MAG: tetratricopeptide repeat protein [Thermoplasmatota archaeon]
MGERGPEGPAALLCSILPERRLFQLALFWLYALAQFLLLSALITDVGSSVLPLGALLLVSAGSAAGALVLLNRLRPGSAAPARAQELGLFVHGGVTAIVAWTLFISAGWLGEVAWSAISLVILMLLFLASALHARLFDDGAAFFAPMLAGLSWPLLVVVGRTAGSVAALSSPLLDGLILSGLALALSLAIATAHAVSIVPVRASLIGSWAASLAMILMVPAHEALGLMSNGSFGPLDKSMALAGLVIGASTLFLLAVENLRRAGWRPLRPAPGRPGRMIADAPAPPPAPASSVQDPQRAHAPPGAAQSSGASPAGGLESRLEASYHAAWLRAGCELLDSGDLEGALERLNRAIQLCPGSAIAWNESGVALRRLGRPEEAEERFRRALALDPRYVAAWSNCGNALMGMGRVDEALRCYDEATGIDPGYELAWYNKGCALFKLGRAEESIEAFERAIEAALTRFGAIPGERGGSAVIGKAGAPVGAGRGRASGEARDGPARGWRWGGWRGRREGRSEPMANAVSPAGGA